MSAPIGGGSAVHLSSGGGPGIALALDADTVYWAETVNGAIRKVPKAGGASVLLATNGATPGHVVVDATYIYWVTPDGKIRRLQK